MLYILWVVYGNIKKPIYNIFHLLCIQPHYFTLPSLRNLSFQFILKRHNDWSDWAQILCGTSNNSRKGIQMLIKSKIFKVKLSKVKFRKSMKKILQICELYYFVLYCSRRRCSKILKKVKVDLEDFGEAE